MRRAGLALLGLLLLASLLHAHAYDVTVSMGVLTAAEHELDAGGVGYFSVGVSPGQGATIVLPVGSSGWLHLKELRGKKLTLLVRVDE